MCLGSIRNGIMSIQQLQSLQQIFDNFQNKTTYFHCFVIGAANHWLGVFINKHDGEIESLVVDSRNVKFFNKSEEDLMQDVLKKLTQAKKRKVLTESEEKFYIKSVHGSLLDSIHAIQLLYDCANGKRNFMQECLLIELNGLIDHCQTIKTKQDLLQYFDSYNPSHLFHRACIKTLTSITITPDLLKRLISWKNHLISLSKNETGKHFLQVHSLIDKMENKFKI
jgi:hypothetical protein